jgi:hypothetical protein
MLYGLSMLLYLPLAYSALFAIPMAGGPRWSAHPPLLRRSRQQWLHSYYCCAIRCLKAGGLTGKEEGGGVLGLLVYGACWSHTEAAITTTLLHYHTTEDIYQVPDASSGWWVMGGIAQCANYRTQGMHMHPGGLDIYTLHCVCKRGGGEHWQKRTAASVAVPCPVSAERTLLPQCG